MMRSAVVHLPREIPQFVHSPHGPHDPHGPPVRHEQHPQPACSTRSVAAEIADVVSCARHASPAPRALTTIIFSSGTCLLLISAGPDHATRRTACWSREPHPPQRNGSRCPAAADDVEQYLCVRQQQGRRRKARAGHNFAASFPAHLKQLELSLNIQHAALGGTSLRSSAPSRVRRRVAASRGVWRSVAELGAARRSAVGAAVRRAAGRERAAPPPPAPPAHPRLASRAIIISSPRKPQDQSAFNKFTSYSLKVLNTQ
ncbi:unnamed protein product [Chrysodeixis includens]|uniref:Uncharacterized protein n=1 Tax=Chrysodeixis includens TaxID=689277 RepID=A0A9N8KSR3_CHRIL|nr:unnamed protein product [Chrysodeixis includens]